MTVVATMVLTAIFFGSTGYLNETMMLPMAICAVCIVTSVIGTFFVRLGAGSTNVMGALYKGLIVTGVLSLGALYLVIASLLPNGVGAIAGAAEAVGITGTITGMDLFWCGAAGLGVTALIVVITEYYTGTNYRPVRSVAQASASGHGTNVIQGLAISLESTALPALTIICLLYTSPSPRDRG